MNVPVLGAYGMPDRMTPLELAGRVEVRGACRLIAECGSVADVVPVDMPHQDLDVGDSRSVTRVTSRADPDPMVNCIGIVRQANIATNPVRSVLPRTRKRLEGTTIPSSSRVSMTEPLDRFDLVNLEINADCVLTDSRMVQEDCCILKVPNITQREATEKPETVEVGGDIMSEAKLDAVVMCVDLAPSEPTNSMPPRERLTDDADSTVAKMIPGDEWVS